MNKFSFTIQDKPYEVIINKLKNNIAEVAVNGKNLTIKIERPEPVVVKPDTLSNHALAKVNSPPYKTYGRTPARQESSQLETTINRPSSFLMWVVAGTNKRGNTPKRNSTRVVYASGRRSDSCRNTAMPAEAAAKTAFSSKTIPTYRKIT